MKSKIFLFQIHVETLKNNFSSFDRIQSSEREREILSLVRRTKLIVSPVFVNRASLYVNGVRKSRAYPLKIASLLKSTSTLFMFSYIYAHRDYPCDGTHGALSEKVKSDKDELYLFLSLDGSTHLEAANVFSAWI